MNAPIFPIEIQSAREAGERVRQELAGLTENWSALPKDHPERPHALFAELYFYVTSSWLDRAVSSNAPELIYRIIDLFFERYRVHVLDALAEPLCNISPHWQPYHKAVRGLKGAPTFLTEVNLLQHAARAHIQGDLCHAIRTAEKERLLRGGDRLMDLRLSIFGSIADDAFFEAMICFVNRQLQHARWSRVCSLFLCRALVIALRPYWLRQLQSWRSKGLERASCLDAKERYDANFDELHFSYEPAKL